MLKPTSIPEFIDCIIKTLNERFISLVVIFSIFFFNQSLFSQNIQILFVGDIMLAHPMDELIKI